MFRAPDPGGTGPSHRVLQGENIVAPSTTRSSSPARGTVDIEGSGNLGHGNALRLTGPGGQRVTAVEDAEILIWEMHASFARRFPNFPSASRSGPAIRKCAEVTELSESAMSTAWVQ